VTKVILDKGRRGATAEHGDYRRQRIGSRLIAKTEQVLAGHAVTDVFVRASRGRACIQFWHDNGYHKVYAEKDKERFRLVNTTLNFSQVSVLLRCRDRRGAFTPALGAA